MHESRILQLQDNKFTDLFCGPACDRQLVDLICDADGMGGGRQGEMEGLTWIVVL